MTLYLRFARQNAPTRKTEVWNVVGIRAEDVLGTIKWFPRWRQYCFFPTEGTIFSRGCLAQIEQFIADRMVIKRNKAEEVRG